MYVTAILLMIRACNAKEFAWGKEKGGLIREAEAIPDKKGLRMKLLKENRTLGVGQETDVRTMYLEIGHIRAIYLEQDIGIQDKKIMSRRFEEKTVLAVRKKAKSAES